MKLYEIKIITHYSLGTATNTWQKLKKCRFSNLTKFQLDPHQTSLAKFDIWFIYGNKIRCFLSLFVKRSRDPPPGNDFVSICGRFIYCVVQISSQKFAISCRHNIVHLLMNCLCYFLPPHPCWPSWRDCALRNLEDHWSEIRRNYNGTWCIFEGHDMVRSEQEYFSEDH